MEQLICSFAIFCSQYFTNKLFERGLQYFALNKLLFSHRTYSKLMNEKLHENLSYWSVIDPLLIRAYNFADENDGKYKIKLQKFLLLLMKKWFTELTNTAL